MTLPDYVTNKHNYWIKKDYPSRNKYKIRYDGSKLDNLLIQISKKLDDKLWGIRVSGLNSEPIHQNFKSETLIQSEITHNVIEVSEHYKAYNITLELAPYKVGFKETHMPWIESYYDGIFREGSLEDFSINNSKLSAWVGGTLTELTAGYSLSTFFGITGGFNPWRCYGYIWVYLDITGYDIFQQCGIGNLTNFGTTHPNEIAKKFEEVVAREKISFKELYNDKSLRNEISRTAENEFRNSIGVKEVGNNNINETYLFSMLHQFFPDVVREWSPAWLKNKRIDFYIPQLNLAIEYHGQQHYEPVDYFGGEEKYQKQIARDKLVRSLCKKNNVHLEEWGFFTPITKTEVSLMLKRYILNRTTPLEGEHSFGRSEKKGT